MKIAMVVTGGLHPSGTREVIPLLLGLIQRLAQAHEVHAFVLRHLAEARSYSLAGAMVHDLGRPRGRWAQWRALQRALMRTVPSISCTASGPIQPGSPARWPVDASGFRASSPATAASLSRCRRSTMAPSAMPVAGRSSVWHVIWRRASTSRRSTWSRWRARMASIRVRISIGIDASQWSAASLDEGPPWRLLQVASLNPVKDQTTLLRAVALARRQADARLDLVGEDTLDGRLQREAAALGLGDVVRFHGFIPHDSLSRFYQAAHLYVQSSLHEGGGASVLEAAASGVPLVGTRVGYLSDWAPEAAQAVPTGDAEALADAIVRLLASPDIRRSLAARARAFVVANDIDATARALSDLYADAIAHS